MKCGAADWELGHRELLMLPLLKPRRPTQATMGFEVAVMVFAAFPLLPAIIQHQDPGGFRNKTVVT